MIKGPGVMRGYHHLDEASAEVLQGDWFATGDMGEIDSHGYVRITDRKKDLIKTSGGKYVAPQKVEGTLKAACPYISQVVVHGEGRKYITALVTLDPESLQGWAAEQGVEHAPGEDLTQHPQVRTMVDGYVSAANKRLERWETVKKFEILPAELSVDEGEVTPSMKIRRKAVEGKYRDLLESMYEKV
jgi:long-chain acyl-CoA synthetase